MEKDFIYPFLYWYLHSFILILEVLPDIWPESFLLSEIQAYLFSYALFKKKKKVIPLQNKCENF